MTIQIPNDINFIGIREYAGRAPIQAPDWGELAESAHYMYERRAVFLGGRIYDGGISTDSTDDFYLSSVPTRVLTGGWDLVLGIYGEHYSNTLTLQNLDTSTTISSTVAVAGGSLAWRTTDISHTDAEIRDDGTTSGDLTLIYGDVDINVDEANSGVVYQIGVWATRNLTASDINTDP